MTGEKMNKKLMMMIIYIYILITNSNTVDFFSHSIILTLTHGCKLYPSSTQHNLTLCAQAMSSSPVTASVSSSSATLVEMYGCIVDYACCHRLLDVIQGGHIFSASLYL